MIKLYVGCGLTYAPEEFKKKVAELKDRFRKIPSVCVLEFLGLEAGDSHDVYVHDIVECVCECDIMVAICDHPSTGLGWEMCEQTKRGMPLFAFGHQDLKITRLILDPRLTNYRFNRYRTFDDIFEIVVTAVQVSRLEVALEV